MRTKLTMVVAAVLATALVAPGGADAQKKKKAQPEDELAAAVGNYTVKFEEIANNCTRTGMTLRKGTVEIGKFKSDMTLTVPMTSTMYGSPPRKGKFRVKSKLGGTGIQGVLGKFSASGRANDGVIQFVLIAEFFTGKNKPLCTQSWNASGVKD